MNLFSPNLAHAVSRVLTTTPSRLHSINTKNPIKSKFSFQIRSIKTNQGDTRMSESVMSDGVESVSTGKDEVIVQYIVLRRDLIESWPLGSVVTQGCHASVAAIWENKDDPITMSYCSPSSINSMHKVTLEVKGETQLVKLSEKLKDGGVTHKVWIEQPENFPTCLATKPYPKSFVSAFFKNMKLCK